MKLIGCLLLLAACYDFGRRKAQGYAKRLYWLEVWWQKLMFLQSEIRYAKTPLPEIFQMLGEEGEEDNPVNDFFAQLSLMMKDGDFRLERAWRMKVKELQVQIPIDYERTCLFGQGMTKVEGRKQVEYMQSYLEQLQQSIRTGRENVKQQQKVVQTVSLCVGALLVLVVL